MGHYARLPRQNKTIVQKRNFPYIEETQLSTAEGNTCKKDFMRMPAGIANNKNIPVLNCSSWILAASHTDHDDGEEEEETGHGKAHPVD